MNKSQHPCLPILLLMLLFLGVQAFLTNQSGATKNLRSSFPVVRALESTETMTCDTLYLVCYERRQLQKDEDTYTISLGTLTNLVLEIFPDQKKDLILSYKMDRLMPQVFLNPVGYPFTEDHRPVAPIIYEDMLERPEGTKVKVIGPLQKVTIYSGNGSSQRVTITLTVSYDGTFPTWVIPVAASVGSVIVITIVALLYYRRRRRLQRQNISNRNSQSVQQRYRTVEIVSQPPSPIQARQARQPQALPKAKPTLREVINICYPETNFSQFESSFPQKTCSVCLDDMQENQPCRQFECQHIFHTNCARKWMENQYKNKKKVFCPNCNKRVSLDTKKNLNKKKTIEATQ